MKASGAALWGGAIALGLLLTAVSTIAWGFGLGRYGEDYCLTRATTDDAGFGGPSMSSPVTVRCAYGETDLVTFDVLPLLWTLGWLAILVTGLGLLVVAVRRARRPSAGAPTEAR